MRIARLMLGAVFALLVLALVVGSWVRPRPPEAPRPVPTVAFEAEPEDPDGPPGIDPEPGAAADPAPDPGPHR